MTSSSSMRLPIRTQHCRFCNHLLLATTRDLSQLPRRSGPALDKALILPLDQDSNNAELNTDTETGPQDRKDTTILLATTIPDRRPTLIRRDDGIEKRLLLRCGRCRVVVGYYLDRVHYSVSTSTSASGSSHNAELENEKPPAVYALPAALVETEYLGQEGLVESEWSQWIRE